MQILPYSLKLIKHTPKLLVLSNLSKINSMIMQKTILTVKVKLSQTPPKEQLSLPISINRPPSSKPVTNSDAITNTKAELTINFNRNYNLPENCKTAIFRFKLRNLYLLS